MELRFVKPEILQAYSAPPIVITQELPARKVTELKPGVYILDFAENFAGGVRLKTRGPAGTKKRASERKEPADAREEAPVVVDPPEVTQSQGFARR